MQASSRALVESTFDTSNPGHLHFGELSGVLMRAQVESHHMDHRSGRTSCHFPDGETLDLAFDWPQDGIADTFEGDAVGRAIRRAQRGRCGTPNSSG